MAGAPEPGGHSGEERAGLSRPLGGGRLATVLLSCGRDVALDPPAAQGAKIGRRAVACTGRYFVRIALEGGLDGVEQRSELGLVVAAVAERLCHDDLRLRVDRGLRVVALASLVLRMWVEEK